MNKKPLLIVTAVLALLLVAGGVFAALHFSSKSEKTSAKQQDIVVEHKVSNIKFDDTLLFYVNLSQLGQKSAIGEVLTDANRSLLATILSGGEDSAYVETLLLNLGASGLNIDEPIYSYANVVDESAEIVVVAEVADANDVDNFVEFISEAIGAYIDVERAGDTRTFSLGNLYFAYNDKRFVVTTCFNESGVVDGEALVNKAMKRSKLNLSGYANFDLAVSLKFMPLLDLALAAIEMNIDEAYEYLDYVDEWEYEWMMAEIRNYEQSMEQIEEVAEKLDDDASVTLGLTFEKGKVVVDALVDGFNYEYACSKVSNDHLEYIVDDVIGVFNVGIDGKKASELISELISADYAEMFGISRNEFNIYFGILCDAIESIDGDITVALNDVDVRNGDIEAVLAVDVNDDYIISNIAQFGGNFLDKTGKNQYSMSYLNNYVTLGQQAETLYGTINADYKKQRNSAANSDWVDELNNSYGYFVVDINNLMKNRSVNNAFTDSLYYLDDMSAKLISDFVDSFNYAYISTESPTSARMVLTFDDQNTNSLEQIVRMLVPAVVGEITRNIF